ncbi:MAG: hypothetical protein M0Q48_01455 [Verrucomicrobia bacterium]|nr:hypothetical protein [Verrucomicrobiota bacterium]
MNKAVLVATIAAVSLSVTLNMGAAIAPETILPESTLAVLTVRDLQKTHAEFQASAMGRLFKDPAMKPFCEYVGEQITNAFNSLNDELGKKNIKLSDYKDILNGGAAFALTSVKLIVSDSTVEDVSALPLFMAEINGGSEKLKVTLDDLQTKLETTFSAEDIAGNEFRRISGTNDDDVTLWIGASGSILYVAASQNSDEDLTYTREQLGKILSKSTGEKLLADSDNFKKHTQITTDRNYAWLNFETIFKNVKEIVVLKDKEYVQPTDTMEAMMAPPRPLVIYNTLGLDALKSWSFTSRNENDGIYSYSTLLCPANERRGITALIDTLETTDCSPAEFIPADPMSYVKFKVNFSKFWDIFDSTTTEAVGGMKMMIFSSMEEQLKANPTEINLRKDLLENLTGEVIVLSYPDYIDVKNNSTPDEPSFDIQSKKGTIILLGTKDTDKFTSTAEALFNILNPEMSGEFMKFFHKMDGYVVLAHDSEELPQVKAFLEAKGKAQENSLAKSPAFRDAAAKIGGFEAAEFGYLNTKAFVSNLYTLWDKFRPIVIANQKNSGIPEELTTALEKLPAWSDIEKYFGISVNNVKVTPEGIESMVYDPWPEGLEKPVAP